MCGIAGYLNFTGAPSSAVILQKMGNAIIHRGPDGEGVYSDGPCGLSHRRLSIIDLSPAGHQPMASADGRFILSYNGEIYNFQELRIELQAKGYRFRSRTDSEVVLNALAEWGSKAFHKFNGMFALALWDRSEHSLLLARDRYGIKPLYYLKTENEIIFGSEIKAILKHPHAESKLDHKGLLEYFTFQNFLGKKTLFEGIETFSPGHWMKIDARGAYVSQQYWDFAFEEPDCPLNKHEYAEELNRLFTQAVNRQLVSDVPIGSYLSGGMDSGSITAIASKQVDNLRTFTVGFDLTSASGLEIGFDERKVAENMSYRFGTEQYEMVLKAGDMEKCMQKLVWHMEEPRVGQSYPNYYAAQLASKFGKVVLSGTGGDELFAGYPWRYYRAAVNSDFEDYINKYYSFWQRLLPNKILAQLLKPIWEDVKEVRTIDIFRNVYSGHSREINNAEEYINHSLYFEAKTFLRGLLSIEDKLSMVHSLETRVPFLDNDLVDFAMQVPVSLKLGNLGEVVRINENQPGNKTQSYFQKTRDGKLLLREVMKKYVSDDVAQDVKRGFSAPDESWFRGESIDYVVETLLSPNARINDYLDRKILSDLVHEHLQGKENRRLLLWSFLCVENFMNVFLDNNARL